MKISGKGVRDDKDMLKTNRFSREDVSGTLLTRARLQSELYQGLRVQDFLGQNPL